MNRQERLQIIAQVYGQWEEEHETQAVFVETLAESATPVMDVMFEQRLRAAGALSAVSGHGVTRAMLAAFSEAQHPRDHNGKFISVGDSVNVKGDDGTERRGEVTKLTGMGPQVQYSDGQHPPMEIIPTSDSSRITVAPKAQAKLGRPDMSAANKRDAAEAAKLPGREGATPESSINVFAMPAADAPMAVKKAHLAAMQKVAHDSPGLFTAAHKRRIAKLAAEINGQTASGDPVTAAFNSSQHLRGSDGKFISTGAQINVTDRSGGNPQRAQVMAVGSGGVHVQYASGRHAVIPSAQATTRISAAPTPVARINPFQMPAANATVEEKKQHLAAMQKLAKDSPALFDASSRHNMAMLQAQLLHEDPTALAPAPRAARVPAAPRTPAAPRASTPARRALAKKPPGALKRAAQAVADVSTLGLTRVIRGRTATAGTLVKVDGQRGVVAAVTPDGVEVTYDNGQVVFVPDSDVESRVNPAPPAP